MTASDFTRANGFPPVSRCQYEEHLRTCLALMGALEASLQGSRQALLTLDLGGTERGTGEQIEWMRNFDEVLRQMAGDAGGKRGSGSGADFDWGRSKELEEELRQSERRIRNTLRLQAALLARIRGKLHVLANMLADPSLPYRPQPPGKTGMLHAF